MDIYSTNNNLGDGMVFIFVISCDEPYKKWWKLVKTNQGKIVNN